MAELPIEYVEIRQLAHSWRVGIISDLVPNQAPHITTAHWDTEDLARQHAQMLHQCTGFPIIEKVSGDD